VAIAAAVAAAGAESEVVVEATYGWYWVVDLLQASGARVHLANPQGLNWGQRRVKNDERDTIDLASSATTLPNWNEPCPCSIRAHVRCAWQERSRTWASYVPTPTPMLRSRH
jgi:hypothetical protein